MRSGIATAFTASRSTTSAAFSHSPPAGRAHRRHAGPGRWGGRAADEFEFRTPAGGQVPRALSLIRAAGTARSPRVQPLIKAALRRCVHAAASAHAGRKASGRVGARCGECRAASGSGKRELAALAGAASRHRRRHHRSGRTRPGGHPGARGDGVRARCLRGGVRQRIAGDRVRHRPGTSAAHGERQPVHRHHHRSAVPRTSRREPAVRCRAVALPFGVDAGSFALSAALLATLPRRPQLNTEHAPLRTAVAEGLRWLRGHRLLRALALLLGVKHSATSLAT